MADKDVLRRLIEQAAEAAEAAPESLREAAFNQAFAYLSSTPGGNARQATRTEESAVPRQRRAQRATNSGAPEGERDLGALERTKYADQVKSATRALDRALWVLHAAHKDLGIDGLTVGEICEVLRSKFRITVKEPAIRMALDRAGREVDTVRAPGKSTLYRIMDAGEDALLSPREPKGDAAPKPKTPARKKAKGRDAKRANPKPPVDQPTGGAVRRSRSGSSAISPAALLRELRDKGYFGTPRTVSDIADHLQVKRGSRINTVSLSVALMRAVRNEELTRDRRHDGTYEYQRHK